MIWEIIGWVSSGIIVFSMMQQRITRLRLINMVGCVIAVAYNAVVGVWPMVGLNAVLAVIQAYNLYVLWRDRHDSVTYSVVPAAASDAVVQHVLATHAEEIAETYRDFQGTDDADFAFLVMKGDEVVGVVIARRDGHEAELIVDYVTAPYRDFTPGEFVFASDQWRREGITSVRSVAGGPEYYPRLGFTRAGGVWQKQLAHGA